MFPQWPDRFVQDYIDIYNDVNRIATALDTTNEDVGDIEQLRIDVADLQLRVSTLEDRASSIENTAVSRRNGTVSRMPRLTINQLTSDSVAASAVTADQINQGGSSVNVNTPAGATAYSLEIYDETGTLLGYAPIYGSEW